MISRLFEVGLELQALSFEMSDAAAARRIDGSLVRLERTIRELTAGLLKL